MNIREIFDPIFGDEGKSNMGEKKIEGFIGIEEASAFLGGMPVNTILEKVRNNTIPAYKPGRHWVFDPQELRAFVKRFKAGK